MDSTLTAHAEQVLHAKISDLYCNEVANLADRPESGAMEANKGQQIRELREERMVYTQTQFAEVCGVSGHNIVSKWENDWAEMSIEAIQNLAEHLGVEPFGIKSYFDRGTEGGLPARLRLSALESAEVGKSTKSTGLALEEGKDVVRAALVLPRPIVRYLAEQGAIIRRGETGDDRATMRKTIRRLLGKPGKSAGT